MPIVPNESFDSASSNARLTSDRNATSLEILWSAVKTAMVTGSDCAA